jgi:hypothetical protein
MDSELPVLTDGKIYRNVLSYIYNIYIYNIAKNQGFL